MPDERNCKQRGRNSSQLCSNRSSIEEDENWDRGELTVLSRENPGEISEGSSAFLLCYVALADDLETLEPLELPGYNAGEVANPPH